MQPPASPTRTTRNLNTRGTTPSPLPAPANVNANPALAAALQGATRAFNKQKAAAAVTADTRPKPNTNTNAHTSNNNTNPGSGPSPNKPTPWPPSSSSVTGTPRTQPETAGRGGIKKDNGALLAATQAVSSRPRSSAGTGGPAAATAAAAVGLMSRHATGGSGSGSGSGSGVVHNEQLQLQLRQTLQEAAAAAGGSGSGSGSAESLLSPHGGGGGGMPSASLVAATLAASRSASPSRGPSPQPSVQVNGGRGGARARGQSVGMVEALDTESIKPTTSLVSLFESKKSEDVDPVKRRAPSVRARSPEMGGQGQGQQERQKVKPKPKPKPKLELAKDTGRTSQGVSQGVGTRGSSHSVEGNRPASPTEKQGGRQAQRPEPRVDRRPLTPPPSHVARVSTPSFVSPKPKKLVETPRLEPPTPPARASTIKVTETTVQITAIQPKPQTDATHLRKERSPTPRRLSQSSASSNDTFVSASSAQSPRATSPTRESIRSPYPAPPGRGDPSLRVLSTPDPQRPPKPGTSSPNISLDSLTNAMVASNLAAARLTTTASQTPPPVPASRRRGHNPPAHSPLQPQLTADSILQPQRTADSLRPQLTGGSATNRSPNRITPQRSGKLLQTLRAPHNPSRSGSDSDSARRHSHHRKRHKVPLLGGGNRKHAHHEGARRRWRDEITARERRRYEAIWASNRGLFLKPGWGLQHGMEAGKEMDDGRAWEGPEAELVVDVVVRDIWSRSRLPGDELAEVWDLVSADRGRQTMNRIKGALGKEEFVVGLWLIDQRLRGRKIPARVSQSVWESAGAGGRGADRVVVPLPKRAKGR